MTQARRDGQSITVIRQRCNTRHMQEANKVPFGFFSVYRYCSSFLEKEKLQYNFRKSFTHLLTTKRRIIKII